VVEITFIVTLYGYDTMGYLRSHTESKGYGMTCFFHHYKLHERCLVEGKSAGMGLRHPGRVDGASINRRKTHRKIPHDLFERELVCFFAVRALGTAGGLANEFDNHQQHINVCHLLRPILRETPCST
jgi:hypothetical protein